MTLILTIHIVTAIILTIVIIPLLIASIVKIVTPELYIISRYSFFSVVASGFILVAVNPTSLTHFCMMMTVYSVATFGVQAFYKRRTYQAVAPATNVVQ